jgi:hypothetical protein
MTWECECGALAAAERAPVRCDTCGRAGVMFVASEREHELDLENGSDLLGSWYEAGFRSAEVPL